MLIFAVAHNAESVLKKLLALKYSKKNLLVSEKAVQTGAVSPQRSTPRRDLTFAPADARITVSARHFESVSCRPY